MSPQVAVRLSEPLLERIDALVGSGRFETRADRERRREIGAAIAEGYTRVPQAEEREDELGTFPLDDPTGDG